MTLGRPTIYKESMLQTIIDLMSEGASIVEVAAEIGVARSTIYEWCKSNPIFSDTIKRGVALSEAWWERNGRVNLFDPHQGAKFNSTLWYMNMKNRFGWRDKTEQTVDVVYTPATKEQQDELVNLARKAREDKIKEEKQNKSAASK